MLLLACSKDGDGDSIVDTLEYTCVDVPQVDGTSASGISYCSVDDDTFGYLNRESATACASDPKDTVPACVYTKHTCADCTADQVCGDSTYGLSCRCHTLCGSDADCGADEACVCALQGISYKAGGSEYFPASIDRCLPGNCRTGADCASGECGASRFDCFEGGPIAGFYCRTAEDESHTNQDCGNDYETCKYEPKLARWACSKGAICD